MLLRHGLACSNSGRCVPPTCSTTAFLSRSLSGLQTAGVRLVHHFPHSRLPHSSQSAHETDTVTILTSAAAEDGQSDSGNAASTADQELPGSTLAAVQVVADASNISSSLGIDISASEVFEISSSSDVTSNEVSSTGAKSVLQEALEAFADTAGKGEQAATHPAAGEQSADNHDPGIAPVVPNTGSFSSIDDEVSPAEIEAAKQVARKADALREAEAAAQAAKHKPWWPPTEFAALVGLGASLVIAGISNYFLCQPASLCYAPQRIVRQCASCCASPAVQAQHQQYILRQPQRLLPPLPLPLRQQLDPDAMPRASYRVKPLVTLQPVAEQDGWKANWVAAQEWVHSRMAYNLQVLATANISTKVMVLWLFASPFILLFGYLYHKAAHVKLGAAMYKVYALLYRVPGVGIAKEDNVASYLVANVVFLAGLFTFAGILGIVSDEIKTGIKNSRSGNYNMRLSGHILILNWNNNTTALLRQIASAHAEGGMFDTGAPWPFNTKPPVVVLADKKKAQMDEAVHEMLRDRGLQLEVHTREGNPYKMSELRRVAASKAGTIIVLHPDSASSPANAEAIKASVAMSITALGSQSDQRVVVQMTGTSPEQGVLSSLGAASRLAGRSAIQSLELPDRQLMLQLVTQTAAQPGILTCWLDILALANNSAQFYCAELPPVLQQKTYAEVRRAFAGAVLCGYRLPTGEAKLNPADTEVPPLGSQLVFLGRGGAAHLIASPESPLYDSAAKSAADRMKKERTYKSKPRNIVVANWVSDGIPELMEGFSQFTPAGSTITFTLQGDPSPDWPVRLGHCKFNFVSTKNPTGVKALVEAGIKTADAVVLGSGATTANDLEADARVLAAVLQVQDAVLACKRQGAPHLVAPIKRYATSKLAQQYLEALAAEQAAAAAAEASATVVSAASKPSPLPGAAAAAATPATAVATTMPSSTSSAVPAAASSTVAASAAAGTAGTAAAAATPSKHGGLLSALLHGVGGSSSSSSSRSQQSNITQQSLAALCDSCEFLVPTDVTSALMTQVVSDPAYADIMKALLVSQEGMEMYLRNPASFNLPIGVPLSFAEVEESVRLTKQTALGYVRGRGNYQAATSNVAKGSKRAAAQQQRKVVLGPPASHTVVFDEGDRIVVLAQDFNV